jgi:hypothetical protein
MQSIKSKAIDMVFPSGRKIIGDDTIAVVFDTSPIRNLAHSFSPDWVKVFSKMRESGYSFFLSDIATAELLTQVRSGRIPMDGYRQMISLCKDFLNQELPMLSGQADLNAIVGINNYSDRLNEIRYLSDAAWEQLQNPCFSYAHHGPTLEEVLDEDRTEWRQFFEDYSEMLNCNELDIAELDPEKDYEDIAKLLEPKLGSDMNIEPSMGVRMHLETRYRIRQMLRSSRKKEPYDPEREKNRNDGIDVGMFRYLILPAFVVADDSGFFGSLNSIESFQKNWFIRPEELARRWLNGENPVPAWPTST